MNQSLFNKILTLILILCLFSCAQRVTQVEFKRAIQVTDKSKIKPIAITKVVAKMRRGTVLGSISGGIACIPQPFSQIKWKSGGKISIDSEELVDVFREELEITMSTFWFPSLGGRGYSHSERKENTKNAILPWNVFSNDELDLIFTQMPLYKQPSPSPSTSPSSACFIATAAFGSPIADEVIVLRNWRDQILMRTFIGQNFVKVYYKLSPPLADYIEKSILMKKFTIFVLYPFIKSLKKNN